MARATGWLMLAPIWAMTLGGARLGAAQGPPISDAARPFVRASGEATITARPDRATVAVGVMTEAATAEAAAAQNAKRTDAVVARLKQLLGPQAQLRTIGYNLSENRRFPRDGGTPTVVGYIANNTVEATIDDLSLVGKVIDGATKAGANNVHRLQFTLKDEQQARAEALQAATKNARRSAEAMASALGLKVVRVLSVSDTEQPPVRPMMEMARMSAPQAMADTTTPIEPGTLEIRASVTLVVEVGQ
jgi:uncharacterized protein